MAVSPQPIRYRPGCDERCEIVQALIPGRFGRVDVYLHDPDAHEAYGRSTATIATGRIVHTGALVVDLYARTVVADGRPTRLTNREWSLLEYLAQRRGRLCIPDEILTSVWGPQYTGDHHLIRVIIARLRGHLGDCSNLIVNHVGRGYLLADVEPIAVETNLAPLPPKRPWSRLFERCVCCGEATSPHHHRGYCSACRAHKTACRDRQLMGVSS